MNIKHTKIDMLVNWSGNNPKYSAGFIIPHEVTMTLVVETFTSCISTSMDKNP